MQLEMDLMFSSQGEKMFKLPRTIKFLLALSLQGRKEDTVVGFEKSLGFTQCQPDFRRVFKFLIQIGAIGPGSCERGIQKYRLRPKALRDYIDELFESSQIYDFYCREHFPPY